MTKDRLGKQPPEAAPPACGFDARKRRAAIGALDALREELHRKHGSMSTQEVVALLGTTTRSS